MNHPAKSSPLLAQLLFVRDRSPYYRELWRPVWSGRREFPGLEHLPVTGHQGYWEANSVRDNNLLTGPHQEGIVFKSGGTTGNPKFSFFSNEDWRQFCLVFGNGMRRGGVAAGERLANIFYGGQLYASLLFISKCIEQAEVGVNYPIAGFAPAPEIVQALVQFRIHTIAGVPTTIVNLLPHLAEARPGELRVKKCLFGGEAMYPDQIEALAKVLPGCRVQSIGVAGVDYGELGWVDESCGRGVHRAFTESTIVEILDERQQPINEPGVEGEIHITNLRRRLMPVIRYPVGDMGAWLDSAGSEGRRFQLLGRSRVGARVGPMTLYLEDLQLVLAKAASHTDYLNFQLVIEHRERRDLCTLRVAVPEPAGVPAACAGEIAAALYEERHMFPELIRDNLVHPLAVEWVRPDELLTNPRTGKLMRLLDRRHES